MKLNRDVILSGIILALIAVLLLQRCGNNFQPDVSPIKVVRDTVWHTKDSIIHTKPQIIHVIPPQKEDVQIYRLHDTVHVDTLRDRYNLLVESYLQTNIQRDSLKIDSLGYVTLYDSVQKNQIVGRSFQYSFKYPTVKETQYIPIKRSNQVYIGGGVSGSARLLVNQIQAGLLFKNKKDQIFGATVGINTLGDVTYGVHSYWKIRL